MTPEPEPTHREKYERWVQQYASELYRFAFRLTGRHAAAEDLLQETFTEAWRSIGKQREPEKARAWLFQILRYQHSRLVRKEVKSEKLVQLLEGEDEPQTSESSTPMTTIANRDALDVALRVLSPDLRKTFLMVFVENLTCRETAAELHIPLGTVLSRLDSARKSLRAAMLRDESPNRHGPTPAKAVQTP